MLGDTITLTGNSNGEQLEVALLKVMVTRSDDQFSGPAAGNKWIAVQFRLRDTGTVAYSDSPTNGAKLIDASGSNTAPRSRWVSLPALSSPGRSM